ncbi:flagellar hook-associated protein FlgK [Thioalkalivibrio sp.]|uniref:flagellar hook-associated protein FlgK n=1 Tax=Thioalkalivibrio sp. TaxID=2093813 RepID=UPI0035677DDB
MGSDILSIGTSGLAAFQRGLSTTGHNIANAGTEGYSRQRVDLNTREPQFAGNAYIGKGVEVGGVNRVFDQFVENQLRTATSSNEQSSVLHDYAKRVDSLLANPDSGLAAGLQRFFAAAQDVATDPTSVPARQVMIAEAESLSGRFGSLHQQLDDQRALVNGQIETTVDEINGISESLAEVNAGIVAATGRAGGAAPNDLLDQRDRLVRELAEHVNVTTVAQDDGALNVFAGNGQSLVIGSNASELVARPLGEDPLQVDVGLAGSGGAVADIGRFMTGGRLGALLEVRGSLLDRAQNDLGLIAQGLAREFNAQHAAGRDLNGEPGGPFFLEPAVEVRGSGSGALPAVAIGDVGELTGDDYRLRFNGDQWELRNTSSNRVVGESDPGNELVVAGLSIGTSGLDQGESFLIRPTRTAAAQIGTAIDDPRGIAAADAGDDDTAIPVGDNTNALRLAGLQDARFLSGDTATLEGSYNAMIGEVGTRTRQAEVSAQAQSRLLDEARNQRESISGVNLDEEAANMLRYQQAYQAAAQVIAVSGTLFDTLLGAVRR